MNRAFISTYFCSPENFISVITKPESAPFWAHVYRLPCGIPLNESAACVYLLPKNKRNPHNIGLDGKYAEDVMRLFLQEIKASKTSVHDYEVKIFGGGDQFPGQDQRVFSVSEQNVKIGRQLLKEYGFKIKSEHLGGVGHRNIIFDLWSGDVWVKHVEKIKE